MPRSVRLPDEVDDRIDVLAFLDRTDQHSAPACRIGSGEQEQGGCAVTGAEALRPDQNNAVAGPDRPAENLGEVRGSSDAFGMVRWRSARQRWPSQ
ncbi:hypothetical protein DER29_1746 [Micromonospora sp. M71_S20]|nr:hypothetical protein DER29_1746 [Micromonospora sp. M71_S20]